MVGVQDLVYRVRGVGFRIQGSGFADQHAGCRVQGVGCRGRIYHDERGSASEADQEDELLAIPSSEHGTYKSVKANLWPWLGPWLTGKSP